MSSAPSQNASSIFSSDSGLSYLPSDELSSSPLSRPALRSSSDIDNEILGIDFLHDILFHQFSTGGVRISVFSDDIDILRHLLSLHGISSFNLTLNDCWYALIYHIFEGFCYDFELDISSASHCPDRTGCHCLAQGFTSRETMTMNAIDLVLFADANIISTDRLCILAQALKLPGEFPTKNLWRHLRSVLFTNMTPCYPPMVHRHQQIPVNCTNQWTYWTR